MNPSLDLRVLLRNAQAFVVQQHSGEGGQDLPPFRWLEALDLIKGFQHRRLEINGRDIAIVNDFDRCFASGKGDADPALTHQTEEIQLSHTAA